MTVYILDWSLSDWFSLKNFSPNLTLSDEGILQLMKDLGLTTYLLDKPCDPSDPDSVFATSYQGWSLGKQYLVASLFHFYSKMFLYNLLTTIYKAVSAVRANL